MAEQAAVVAEGLVKRFGEVHALAGVDLEVRAGGVLGLLGPNGAGKTTAVRILATLLVPDAGRAWVMGLDVERQAAAVRRVIGLSGQYAAVDAYLTGRENLRMIGRLSGLGAASARRRTDELVELFELTDAAGRTVRTYSGGMRRRLDVAASLVARPAVLFLDEPTTGLDPRGRRALWLKAQVGGERLELQTPPGEDAAPLAAAMAGLGSGPPTIDADTGRVVVPVSDGPGILPDVAARLAAAGVRVSDLALRRPTLDDVFLTLTGQPTNTVRSTTDILVAGRAR